jgi:hypothetical protein
MQHAKFEALHTILTQLPALASALLQVQQTLAGRHTRGVCAFAVVQCQLSRKASTEQPESLNWQYCH